MLAILASIAQGLLHDPKIEAQAYLIAASRIDFHAETFAFQGGTQELSRPQKAQCSIRRFRGKILRGENFKRPVASGLTFGLRASKDPAIDGWTIEICSESLSEPDNELSWVATPPYRSWNPRYIETSYGWTAKEAVEVSEREFGFVSSADYKKTADAVRILLWPADHTKEEIRQAERLRKQMRVGTGKLRILTAQLGAARGQGDRGTIERMDFKVELCVPKGEELVPSLPKETQFVTIAEGMTSTSPQEGIRVGYRMFTAPDLQAACTNSKQPASLFFRNASLLLRIGRRFHLGQLVVLAVNGSGQILPPVPIALDAELKDPPLLDLKSDSLSDTSILPLASGRLRLRARTVCPSQSVGNTLPVIVVD